VHCLAFSVAELPCRKPHSRGPDYKKLCHEINMLRDLKWNSIIDESNNRSNCNALVVIVLAVATINNSVLVAEMKASCVHWKQITEWNGRSAETESRYARQFSGPCRHLRLREQCGWSTPAVHSVGVGARSNRSWLISTVPATSNRFVSKYNAHIKNRLSFTL